jgi:hypothetical protein
MALRTALVIDGDSEGAKRALAELDRSLDQAEASAEQVGQEWVKASVGLERLRVAQEQAAAAGIKLNAEQQRAAIHGRAFMTQQSGAVATMGRLTASAAQQRAGMQQLSFQIGDVATMFAMGARPMQIFASQGTQVVQAIGMMRGSGGGLVGFLGGPWGVAITAGAIALTPLIERLFDTRDAANEVSDALRDAVRQFNSSLPQASARTEALTKFAKLRVDALADLGRLNREIGTTERTISALQGSAGTDPRAVASLTARLAGLQDEKAAAEKRAEEADRQARQAMADAAVSARQQARLNEPNDTHGGRATRSSGAVGTRTAAISDEAKAIADAKAQSDRYIAGLEDEIAKIGLDAAALRQLEVARAMEAAQTEDQRTRIAELNQEREWGLELEAMRQRAGAIAEDSKELTESIAAIEREAQVLGLVGHERERALLHLEREAAIRPLLAQLAEAEAKGLDNIAKGLREQIALLDKKYGLQIQIGDEAAGLRAEAGAVDQLMDGYRQLGEAGVGALSAIALHGENAGDVIERLSLSIADAALQAMLLGSGPLAGVFGGGGAGGLIGSIVGTIGSLFGGGRANGGPVSPGNFYAVNETSTAPGLFFPLAPGRIEPPGNDNGHSGGGGVTVVRVELSDDLDARIRNVSGAQAVEIVRTSAPSIVEAAAAETTRRLVRPRI